VGHRVGGVYQVQPTTVADHPVLLVEPHRGAHRAAHRDADPVRVRLGEVDAARRHRPARGDHRELRGPVHAPDLLGRQPVRFGIEVYLCGDLRPERAWIEEGDPPGRRTPLADQVPEALQAQSSGREHLQPGDHHPTATHAASAQL
jgi:hypothetical protein